MTVWGSERYLMHTPGFILRGFQNLGARSDGSAVEAIDVVDAEVRDIAVIAELTGRGNVWAAAEHKGDIAGAAESPVARVYVIDVAPEDVAIPRTGLLEVVNGENRMRARDLHNRHSARVTSERLRDNRTRPAWDWECLASRAVRGSNPLSSTQQTPGVPAPRLRPIGRVHRQSSRQVRPLRMSVDGPSGASAHRGHQVVTPVRTPSRAQ